MVKKEDNYKIFTSIETHTVGEPTRIITSGFPECDGSTMMEKKQFLENNYDHLRSCLMCEPRGHKDMVGAVIVPKVNKQADFGAIFMDAERWVNMCGHATMGCATYAVEKGLVSVREPYTEVVIDTPVGMIPTKVKVENGRAVEVTISNVPSFLFHDNLDVKVDGINYKVSISFGGTFFALIDASQLHINLEKEDISMLIPFTKRMLIEINKQLQVKHPVLDIERVVNAEFYLSKGENSQRNIVIAEEGQVDRSPCGTGTSAKLAYLYAIKNWQPKDVFINESFTNAKFKGSYEEEVEIGPFKGIRALITGSAFIVGEAKYIINENDPLRYGFNI